MVETLLMSSLLKFYKKKDNLSKLIDVVERNTNYSLRILEWVCSNYFKKNNTIITLNGKEINCYLSYKDQLNSYSKKKFDPFQRINKGFPKIKIPYPFPNKENKLLETTEGQLNFFRWCIENNILDYVKNHIKSIKDDMNSSINYPSSKKSSKNKDKDKDKDKQPRKKRQSLTSTKPCIKIGNSTNVLLSFNKKK